MTRAKNPIAIRPLPETHKMSQQELEDIYAELAKDNSQENMRNIAKAFHRSVKTIWRLKTIQTRNEPIEMMHHHFEAWVSPPFRQERVLEFIASYKKPFTMAICHAHVGFPKPLVSNILHRFASKGILHRRKMPMEIKAPRGGRVTRPVWVFFPIIEDKK